MASASRETIMQALFQLVDGYTPNPFIRRSRATKHWTEVDLGDMPAFFQLETGETGEQLSGTPEKRTLQVLWLAYVNRGSDLWQPSGTLLNPLLDVFDTVLKAPPGFDKQTLGGLVTYARHAGKTDITEGPLGPQIIVSYPIHILVPVDYQ
jgi:hypothetical protein